MKPLSAILALLVAVAGWYYMFYSRAAHHLGQIEGTTTNLQRVRLRRVNGFVMFVLSVCIFAITWTFDPRQTPGAFLSVFVTMVCALFVMVLLALLDLRLTYRLRQRRRNQTKDSEGNTP